MIKTCAYYVYEFRFKDFEKASLVRIIINYLG